MRLRREKKRLPLYDFRLSFPTFLGELDSMIARVLLTWNHLGLFARLITSCSISSMVLLQHARVFFRLLLESRNYKIRIVARVGGRSAVVLSGIMEASCSRFFIGRGFDCSRGRFRCSSIGFENYHPEASNHLKSRRIGLSKRGGRLTSE